MNQNCPCCGLEHDILAMTCVMAEKARAEAAEKRIAELEAAHQRLQGSCRTLMGSVLKCLEPHDNQYDLEGWKGCEAHLETK